ncbi:hypothetical protein [Defluviitalea saccharophila]|uniref:Glycosyltransferase n=1 Tax=Defluviitalea saccharophila TaxID=879970 RepID=A0ABZ2Y095_9FIRM|nr:glycosyltransferase family 9 protein [Candidatus Epulonipiscium sp.]
MKKLLIIRSVSFQQLDNNLKAIKDKFPEHEIHLLTHEHGRKLAEKYKGIKQIWIYPYKEGFGYSRKCQELENEHFDVVIVPCTNLSGTGFINVFLFSLSIHVKERYKCNLISEIKAFSKVQVMFWWIRSQIFKIISLFLSGIIGIMGFGVFFLCKGLGQLKTRK